MVRFIYILREFRHGVNTALISEMFCQKTLQM